MSVIYAAGALCSTVSDLVRWNIALVSGRAVSPESYRRMTTEGPPAYGGVYGFGVIADSPQGRSRVWHNGGLPGYQSYLSWFPDENLTVAVLINASDPLRSLSYEIGIEVERAMQ
jgi:CubicO group peptidase (beta-lactamase class C family)